MSKTNFKANKIRILIKQKYPQEIIDFISSDKINYNDKYTALLWIASEKKKSLNRSNFKINFDNDYKLSIDEFNFILDWSNSVKGINLTALSFNEAYRLSQEWHNSIRKDFFKEIAFLNEPLNPEQIEEEINGFYIVKLNAEDLDREGCLMKHCIGQRFYQNRVRDDKLFVYSIRDKKNLPHVTISVKNSEECKLIIEFKGKEDKYPKISHALILYKWLLKKIKKVEWQENIIVLIDIAFNYLKSN